MACASLYTSWTGCSFPGAVDFLFVLGRQPRHRRRPELQTYAASRRPSDLARNTGKQVSPPLRMLRWLPLLHLRPHPPVLVLVAGLSFARSPICSIRHRRSSSRCSRPRSRGSCAPPSSRRQAERRPTGPSCCVPPSAGARRGAQGALHSKKAGVNGRHRRRQGGQNGTFWGFVVNRQISMS